MMKKGLGRGLADLRADLSEVDSVEIPVLSNKNRVLIRQLNLDEISPNPDQPRKDFKEEELQELSESIQKNGVLQAILVREVSDKNYKYEIIAGERRWRASKLAGLSEIPAVIRSVDDKNALEMAIIENIQRENLNAMEESIAYQNLIDNYNYSMEDLSKVLGKSVSYLRNSLRLIKLPDCVKNLVKDNKLSAGHARALVVVDDKVVENVAQQIIDKKLSVRDTEILVKSKPRQADRSAKNTGILIQDRKKLEQKIKLSTGLKSQLSVKVSGEGVLKIFFNNKSDMDRLISILTDN